MKAGTKFFLHALVLIAVATCSTTTAVASPTQNSSAGTHTEVNPYLDCEGVRESLLDLKTTHQLLVISNRQCLATYHDDCSAWYQVFSSACEALWDACKEGHALAKQLSRDIQSTQQLINEWCE